MLGMPQAGTAHTPGAGSPQQYDDAVFYAILERHAAGENLIAILRDEGMPQWYAFWKRCCAPDAAKEMATAYERASASWATHRLHGAVEIAEHTQVGEEITESEGPKGTTRSVKKSDMLGHRQLRIRQREWFAERLLRALAPKTTLQNPDGSPIMRPVIRMTILPPPKEPT